MPICWAYCIATGATFPWYFESVDFTPRSRAEQGIVDIVLEEAEAYFAGDRSLEDVVRFIQNRAQLLLDEQKK